MKKISKIIIGGLMISSFQMQFASDHSSSSSSSSSSIAPRFNEEATVNLCRIILRSKKNFNKEIQDLAQKAISDNADVNAVYDSHNLLFWAWRLDNYKMVDFLLKNGADASSEGIVIFNGTATSILIEACRKHKPEEFGRAILTARQALEYGADVNFNCRESGIIKLYRYESGLEDNDPYGNTPLYYACYNSNYELVQLLLDNNATLSINQISRGRMTPLSVAAAKRGNLKLVELLLSKSFQDGQTALDLSCHYNIDALHYAIDLGYLDIVKAIITSNSFHKPKVISVQNILNSLRRTDDHVSRFQEQVFNDCYPDLKGKEREAMIEYLESYLSPGLK